MENNDIITEYSVYLSNDLKRCINCNKSELVKCFVDDDKTPICVFYKCNFLGCRLYDPFNTKCDNHEV